MDKNNNIEDFFNNSMDQFNDGPPDTVWDGIGGMLDEHKTPLYQNRKFWAGMGALLVLCAVGLYIFNTHQKINSLNDKLDDLELQNIELQSQIIDCGERADKMIHIINGYKSEQDNDIQTPLMKPADHTIGKVDTPVNDIENLNYTSPTETTNEYRTSQIIETPVIPIQNTTNTLVEKGIKDENISQTEEKIIEDILPTEFNEEIDSIIIENNEMMEKGKKMVDVPIFSVTEDSLKSVEIENMNPNVGENIKERFNRMKDNLKEKKWNIFKRKKKRNSDSE